MHVLDLDTRQVRPLLTGDGYSYLNTDVNWMHELDRRLSSMNR